MQKGSDYPGATRRALDGRTPKYRVEKTDGSPMDPHAKYLVLRIDGKQPWSPEAKALRAYIVALEERISVQDDELVAHLRRYFGRPDL